VSFPRYIFFMYGYRPGFPSALDARLALLLERFSE